MAKKDIWDILFWIAMLVLIGYIIAKLTWLINTPEWVNLIPIITITFMVGVSYQKIITFMDVVYKRTDYLKNNLEVIKLKVSEHENTLSSLKNK